MTVNRRTFLTMASGIVLSPAFAEEAPPVLANMSAKPVDGSGFTLKISQAARR